MNTPGLKLGGALLLVCLACACGSGGNPTQPPPPAFDIRGVYPVTWYVSYMHVGDDPAIPNPSMPHGYGPATLEITETANSHFRATLTVPDGVEPPLYAGSAEIVGIARRSYLPGDPPYDYGYSLYTKSDIGPLLHCVYLAPLLGDQTSGGTGNVQEAGSIRLTFSNVYLCGADTVWIIATALRN